MQRHLWYGHRIRETAQNDAMQILLSIIIHKSFPKAINGRFCLQKRNKFHKQAFPHKVISRSPAGMQTMENKAGREKTDILIKLWQAGIHEKTGRILQFLSRFIAGFVPMCNFCAVSSVFLEKGLYLCYTCFIRNTFLSAAAAYI